MSLGSQSETPVACVSFVHEHPWMLQSGRCARAHTGMRVKKKENFTDAQWSGRVCPGVGSVVHPDVGLNNITVFWSEVGETTVWTRAGVDGFDVVVA